MIKGTRKGIDLRTFFFSPENMKRIKSNDMRDILRRGVFDEELFDRWEGEARVKKTVAGYKRDKKLLLEWTEHTTTEGVT